MVWLTKGLRSQFRGALSDSARGWNKTVFCWPYLALSNKACVRSGQAQVSAQPMQSILTVKQLQGVQDGLVH